MTQNDIWGRPWSIRESVLGGKTFFMVFCDGGTVADYVTRANAEKRVKREVEKDALFPDHYAGGARI